MSNKRPVKHTARLILLIHLKEHLDGDGKLNMSLMACAQGYRNASQGYDPKTNPDALIAEEVAMHLESVSAILDDELEV